VSARALRALFAAAAGFPAGYLLSSGLQLPVLAYDPVARRVFIAAQVHGPQMRYYGDLLWACAAAALCALVALAWPARRPFSPGVACASALALAALHVAYFVSRVLAAP
jgi:hypothetical protein